MRIWWPSLKKCLIAEYRVVTALLLGLIALSPAMRASTVPSPHDLIQEIIEHSSQSTFEPLLRRWQIVYGEAAVTPLLQLASAYGSPEPRRYMALMGAARLGGRGTAPKIAGFLKDPSWMLRSASLRALTALKDPSTYSAILPLLHDPSLAVRLEAVTATSRLRPAGATQALMRELASSENYRAGKALWVPGRVLAALSALHASQAAPGLRPLLDHTADPDLLIETVATLETLTGRVLKPGAPLLVRVREWKLALESK